MISLEKLKACAVNKLLNNFLPTKAEFDASLSSVEINNFTKEFFNKPNEATAMVNTRIRQLAEAKALAYVENQISSGTFTIDDLRHMLD